MFCKLIILNTYVRIVLEKPGSCQLQHPKKYPEISYCSFAAPDKNSNPNRDHKEAIDKIISNSFFCVVYFHAEDCALKIAKKSGSFL